MGFGNSCKAKNIYLSKKSLERKVSKTYDLQTKFLLYPKNHMFKSAFFVTLSRENIGFGDEVYQWGVYQWYLIFWIWGVISKLENFWHLTYYSQSWSRKSGLCENCIPTSSSFRLPYALLALAKIGKVSLVQTLWDDYDGKEEVGEEIVRVDGGKSWLMRPDNCIELVPFGRVVILNLSSTSSANFCTKYKHYGIQIQILQNTNINANTWFLLAELSSQASPGQPIATFCANCGTQYSRKLAFKFL